MNRIIIIKLNLKNILRLHSLCMTSTFLLPSVLNRTNEAYKILASDSNQKTVPKTPELGSYVTSPTGVFNPL